MKFFFILFNFLILFPVFGETCHISTYEEIVILSSNSPFNFSPIKNSKNCNSEQLKKIEDLLKLSSGVLKEKYIFQIDQKMKITPSEIKISNIEDLLPKEKDETWKRLSSLGKNFPLFFEEKIGGRIDCSHCNKLGQVNFRYILSSGKSFWISGEKVKRIVGLRVKKDFIQSMSEFKTDDFSLEIIETAHPEDLFLERDHLNFFQSYRKLQKGDILFTNMLRPSHLVKYGRPVKLILKKGNLKLFSEGTSLQNGAFNEFIKIKNDRNQKIISGKVIDYNKVLVEL